MHEMHRSADGGLFFSEIFIKPCHDLTYSCVAIDDGAASCHIFASLLCLELIKQAYVGCEASRLNYLDCEHSDPHCQPRICSN